MHLRTLVLAVAALASLSQAAPAHHSQPKIHDLVVFGDSYSDTGNVYRLSNHTWPLPAFYNHGRFTNGKVWSEVVAESRKYRLTNYAYGSATTDSAVVQGYSGADSTIAVPGFMQQISTLFVPHIHKFNLANTLVAVDLQGNDFFFDSNATATQVLSRVEIGVRHLLTDLGVKHLLIIQTSNFGTLPYFASDPATTAYFTGVAKDLHSQYGVLIAKLQKEFKSKGVRIVTFDQYEAYTEWQSPKELKKLGITNLTTGCVSADYKTKCKDPLKHFFFDSFHPNSIIHEKIGEAVDRVI